MTISFYVKTTNEPNAVARVVCDFNAYQGEHPEDKYTWIVEPKKSDGEEYWEIKGKYAPLKDLTLIGIAYKAGDTVVLGEVDDDLAANFLDPLLEKYGFEILEQRKTLTDIRILFQLINSYIFRFLNTHNTNINMLLCLIFMSPINIFGQLLYKVFPKNEDLYLDNVILGKKVTI